MRIDESMSLFLEELSGKRSRKTVEKYADVLRLFHDYLASYGELSHEEHRDRGIILTADTQELHDGQVSNFLEWFLIRKVLGPQWLITSAPGVIKAYAKWLHQQGLLTQGIMKEVAETAKKAGKDLPRVEKASALLYMLCSNNSDRFAANDFADKDYREGYGEVTGIIEDKLHLSYEGEKTGPIQITKEIAQLLRKGDTVNLVVGKKGKLWYPIEVGNVYPA